VIARISTRAGVELQHAQAARAEDEADEHEHGRQREEAAMRQT